LTEKPYCEHREGVLYPKPMPTNSTAPSSSCLWLGKLDFDAVFLRLSSTKYLVPDVIAAPDIQNPYPTEPVLLCCEILSLDDPLGGIGTESARGIGALHAGDISISLTEIFSALPAVA
jgi:hypothetical protein